MILTILVRQRQRGVAVAAVGMQMGRQNARRFRSPQHHRPCAIAKQNDGAAIQDPACATRRRADNQRMFDRTVFHVLIGHAERVSKAGAGRSQIERRAVFDAQHLLHQARRARERVVVVVVATTISPMSFSHTCHFQRFQRPGSSSSQRFHPQRRCDVRGYRYA